MHGEYKMPGGKLVVADLEAAGETVSGFEQWVASLPIWGQFPVVLGIVLPVCILLAWLLLRTIDLVSGWVRAVAARRGLGYDESTNPAGEAIDSAEEETATSSAR